MLRKLTFIFVALLFANHLMAVTRYVNYAATGSNNGTSWTNAFTSLTSALDAAASGDQIWVAAGIYKPTKDINGNANPTEPRSKTFTMKNNVTLYGGFIGNETSLGQRNWTTHVTVLSGDLGGNDINTNGVVLDWSEVVGTENCFNVVTEWNVTCTLDGFTITAGLGDKNAVVGLPGRIGNGMMCAWGNTTLRNMIFRGNHGNLLPGGAVYFWEGTGVIDNVSFIGNDGCQGGAAYSRNSTTTYTNVLFQDNEARDPLGQSGTAAVSGGGIYVSGTGTTLNNCQFINNSAKISGGGLETYNNITVSNSTFQGNSAQYGGGLWDEGGSILTDINFISNHAERGGGMACHQLSATGIYTRLTFQNNSATLQGGGLQGEGVSPVITNCIFTGNQSSESGGALWFYYGTPSLINTVINSNSATYGSAVCSMFGQFTMTGVTIYGNSGSYLIYDYTGSGTTNIRNTIIWGNSGTVYSGDVPVSARYSIIQGGLPSGWTGTNVLNSNPLFINPTNGNFILQNTSPAIDAGDNTITNPSLPSTDIIGNLRRVDNPSVTDTGLGTAPITDMGAYEWTSCNVPTSGGTIAGIQSICQNTTPLPLTNSTLPTGGSGIYNYKWQYSTTSGSSGFNDISNSNSTGLTLGSLTQTTWYKRLARTDCMSSWTGAAESNVIQITVNPTYNIIQTAEVCSGGSYTFPDGTTQNNITSQVTHTSYLHTVVKLCDSTIVTTVNVNPVYNIPQTVEVCSGGSYTFPDGTTQNNITSQITHTSYLHTVGKLCDSTIVTTVNVNPVYNIPETVEVCSGGSYTFPDGTTQNNITSQVTHTSYLHTVGKLCDSTIVTTVNVNPVYNIPETVEVCSGGSYTFPDGTTITNITSQIIHNSNLLTVGKLCDSIIVTTVNVIPLPTQPTITLTGNVLHSSANTGNQWYDLNGIISGATGQDYTVTANGSYYDVVTMLGCSSEPSDTLVVLLSGIENDNILLNIQAYPNPVSNELFIEFTGNNEKINFEILDLTGKVIFTGNLINNITVPVSNFTPGFYIIKFENGNVFEFKKIVKE